MTAQLSKFARSLSVETAFTVLAVAKSLKTAGKDVVELEIGDSPFDSTASAKAAGVQAIEHNQSHYCPSPGIPEFREAAARFVKREFNIPAEAKNIVAGPGAKVFEQFFCEAFLDPGDGVLVFGPYFPTYLPNIERAVRGPSCGPCCSRISSGRTWPKSRGFWQKTRLPRRSFSIHRTTRPAAWRQRTICSGSPAAVRGKNVAVFSDEPYCHMVWKGKHASILAQPGMLDQSVAAFTFSKSYSMSGWRLGFAVAGAPIAEAIGKMINTTLSCTPALVQLAGAAALDRDQAERDAVMLKFRDKVELLTTGLNRIEGFRTLDPTATFYVFPNVAPICNRLGITSHGLALYLLEGADDKFGIACLGGECFGDAGRGFLRFSCAEPNDRLQQALDFLPVALSRTDRIGAYLEKHAGYRLKQAYAV